MQSWLPTRTLLTLAVAFAVASAGCGGDGRTADRAAGEEARGAPAPTARASDELTGLVGVDQEGRLVFAPCGTRTMVPVRRDEAAAPLAAAHERWRQNAADRLLATVVGRIAVPPDAGPGPDEQTPMLLVDRFVGIWPGETCGRPGATAQLEDMYWKLTRLEGGPVLVAERQREPHLVLHSQDRRLAGSTGCNRLQGAYALDGGRLSFEPIATTRMACPDPRLQEQERSFLAALERVEGLRLQGQHLELLAEDGAVVLRLEERALTH